MNRGVVISIMALLVAWWLSGGDDPEERQPKTPKVATKDLPSKDFPSENSFAKLAKSGEQIRKVAGKVKKEVEQSTKDKAAAQKKKNVPQIFPPAETPAGPPVFRNPLAVKVQQLGEHKVFQGDLLLPKKLVEKLKEKEEREEKADEEKDDTGKGLVEVDHPKLWPRGIVPYVIDPSLPAQARVLGAIDEINNYTNVTLVERKGHLDYVVFKPGDHCLSYLGRQGGPQEIYLADRCGRGNVIHEILHALGFLHEHMRPDRDNYIKIQADNIKENYKSQFAIASSDYLADIDVPFDYDSVMLYGSFSFARHSSREIVSDPRLATIVDRGGALIETNRLGLSDLDMEKIDVLYPLAEDSP